MSTTKRKYTTTMRRQALTLLSQGTSQTEVSKRLGIPNQTLSTWWRNRDQEKPENSNRPSVSAKDAEISRLTRALAQSREEVDILKKATAYFASLRK